MEQSDLLRKLAAELERLGISYLVTGSTATIAYGEPRLTNDIDVVVELRLDQLDAFCAAFPAPEYYFSKDAAIQANRMANSARMVTSRTVKPSNCSTPAIWVTAATVEASTKNR